MWRREIQSFGDDYHMQTVQLFPLAWVCSHGSRGFSDHKIRRMDELFLRKALQTDLLKCSEYTSAFFMLNRSRIVRLPRSGFCFQAIGASMPSPVNGFDSAVTLPASSIASIVNAPPVRTT